MRFAQDYTPAIGGVSKKLGRCKKVAAPTGLQQLRLTTGLPVFGPNIEDGKGSCGPMSETRALYDKRTQLAN